jgi:ribosomal protein S8
MAREKRKLVYCRRVASALEFFFEPVAACRGPDWTCSLFREHKVNNAKVSHSQMALTPFVTQLLICRTNCDIHNYFCVFAGYIGEFEIIDDHRSNKIVIELTGRLNKCGVISPRFDVAFDEIEKWIVNLLPSRQFGHILLSTTYGIMTHEEARRKKTGGKILGFFY